MNPSPRFLSVADVLRLHAIAIEDQGGDASLRDSAALESAVATPAQQFGGQYLHEDIPAMAAAYAFHICMNHPFLDGNKRAAAAAMIAFLAENGWSFDANADEAEQAFLALAAGSLEKPAFTDWARKHMHEKPKLELREFFAQLKYQSIAESVLAGFMHDNPQLAHNERFDTIIEAARAIPAINDATLNGVRFQEAGNNDAVATCEAHMYLLAAIYRIAQDMGYEW